MTSRDYVALLRFIESYPEVLLGLTMQFSRASGKIDIEALLTCVSRYKPLPPRTWVIGQWRDPANEGQRATPTKATMVTEVMEVAPVANMCRDAWAFIDRINATNTYDQGKVVSG